MTHFGIVTRRGFVGCEAIVSRCLEWTNTQPQNIRGYTIRLPGPTAVSGASGAAYIADVVSDLGGSLVKAEAIITCMRLLL